MTQCPITASEPFPLTAHEAELVGKAFLEAAAEVRGAEVGGTVTVVEETGNTDPEPSWMVVEYPSADGKVPDPESEGKAIAWFNTEQAAHHQGIAALPRRIK